MADAGRSAGSQHATHPLIPGCCTSRFHIRGLAQIDRCSTIGEISSFRGLSHDRATIRYRRPHGARRSGCGQRPHRGDRQRRWGIRHGCGSSSCCWQNAPVSAATLSRMSGWRNRPSPSTCASSRRPASSPVRSSARASAIRSIRKASRRSPIFSTRSPCRTRLPTPPFAATARRAGLDSR